MKQILVWKGKHDTGYYDISTQELKRKSYLTLFKQLKEWSCYDDIKDNGQFQELQREMAKLQAIKDKIEPDAQLFQYMKGCFDVSRQINQCQKALEQISKQQPLYQKAKNGDWQAARDLIMYRSREGYEYEKVHEEDVY